MKVRKRINYYHNRHRSDGALIENQRKRIENQEELLILSEPEEKKTLNQKYKKGIIFPIFLSFTSLLKR